VGEELVKGASIVLAFRKDLTSLHPGWGIWNSLHLLRFGSGKEKGEDSKHSFFFMTEEEASDIQVMKRHYLLVWGKGQKKGGA